MNKDVESIASFEEKTDAIQELITPEFLKRMIAYSIFRFDKRFNIKFDLNKGFRGIMIDDIISETIESFLKPNGRNWYVDKYPVFETQFISALDSVISNTIKKELPRTNQTVELLDGDNTDFDEDETYDEEINECIRILKQLKATDDELLLFEPYIVNRMKREDLANEFGISVDELTNIKKRLDRKIPLLRAELTKRSKI